nr:immunoglobulin light chain junction region [Macaca mulatta]
CGADHGTESSFVYVF